MFSKSSWLHLRIPFSFLLLPVFFFALALSPNLNQSRLLWVLLIVHFFIYPASNGYNSFFDKDEKSIGGIKNPPPINSGLYYLTLLFDALGIILGILKVNFTFGIMLLVYGFISKAYSHPSIRLKKFPWGGWITVGIFQGFFMLITCYIGINDFSLETALAPKILIAGLLASVMLLGSYPMTQIYQHDEDAKRGDLTISQKLGVRGTFHFTLVAFGVAAAGFTGFFQQFYKGTYSFLFLAFMTPVILYFLFWYLRVRLNISLADYSHTMWLNFISALCLNSFFVYFFLDASSILNIFIH